MRLQFSERAPELLLDPVHLVEERSTVDLQLPAAELPIRAQEKVVLEHLVLILFERSPADQAEISDILLVL